MKTYIYALDLSLNSTGICLFTNDGKFVKALTIDTHRKKETKFKLKQIGETMNKLITKYPPSKIIIEKGFSRFNKSTQAIFRVHGIINYLFCDYEQIYYPSSSVKKLITGKGNSNKLQVQNKILEKYPKIKFNNFDESDAFSVGEMYFLKNKIK